MTPTMAPAPIPTTSGEFNTPPLAPGVAPAARFLFFFLPPVFLPGLGLPGLGSLSCLCSTPLFFSNDETVSDGIAPVWIGNKQGYVNKSGKFIWNPTS